MGVAFSGLIALLDDIATVADDVATLAVAATKKTTGIVTDDMAVTAEQAVGLARERELPVVAKVAWGSLKNKALLLAPGALLLNAIAPWSITPLLMAGGTYLAFEGVEKLLHKFLHHEGGDEDGDGQPDPVLSPEEFEQVRVSGAIRTDVILSAEIIAITLGEVTAAPLLNQVLVLYGVSVIMTAGVYGMVAALVKIDDAGDVLVARGGGSVRLGRMLLWGAPWLLHAIAWVGAFAMLMVGGHIVLEGVPYLAEHVHHWLHELPAFARTLLGPVIDTAIGGVVGLLVVGAMATGVPGRLWALVPRLKRTT